LRGGEPTELAKRRCVAGMRQQDIAKKLGISQGRYSTIENEKTTPDVVLAQRIAEILKCKVTDLWPRRARRGRTTRAGRVAA
jgi:DNA-binding XRE family transcriptional regulator